MIGRRTVGVVLLFLPLMGFILVLSLPYYAGRLSLVIHGMPFARVSKEDTLKYVETDFMLNAGIVVSQGRAVGWIYQPRFAFARFVRFTGTPNLGGGEETDLWSDYRLIKLWTWRWWLLAAQGVVLLLWFGFRAKRGRNS